MDVAHILSISDRAALRANRRQLPVLRTISKYVQDDRSPFLVYVANKG